VAQAELICLSHSPEVQARALSDLRLGSTAVFQRYARTLIADRSLPDFTDPGELVARIKATQIDQAIIKDAQRVAYEIATFVDASLATLRTSEPDGRADLDWDPLPQEGIFASAISCAAFHLQNKPRSLYERIIIEASSLKLDRLQAEGLHLLPTIRAALAVVAPVAAAICRLQTNTLFDRGTSLIFPSKARMSHGRLRLTPGDPAPTLKTLVMAIHRGLTTKKFDHLDVVKDGAFMRGDILFDLAGAYLYRDATRAPLRVNHLLINDTAAKTARASHAA
jgi:hypothetical protein